MNLPLHVGEDANMGTAFLSHEQWVILRDEEPQRQSGTEGTENLGSDKLKGLQVEGK
jgi:hypothetical protein